MASRKRRIDWIAITSSCLAASVYLNSLNGGFVYDDSRAILSNQDILPSSTWAVLWNNDFWGTPLTHSASHKSFRPLTTLSFRLNYYFSGFNPWTYHLTNVILHTLTTWLFVQVARLVFRPSSLYQFSENCFGGSGFSNSNNSPQGSGSNTRQSSPQPSTLSSSLLGSTWKSQRRNGAILLSSLLFACHPIHTEAVAGVVGRADVGSTAFALTAFLAYVNHVKYRDKYQLCSRNRHHSDDHLKTEHRCPYSNSGNNMSRKLNGNILVDQYSGQTSSVSGPIPHHQLYLKSFMYLIASIILATAAMLTKEQGITILLICATYDLIRSIIRTRRYQEKLSIWNVECRSSVLVLGASFLLLFHLRLNVMGGYAEAPKFSRADNPIPHHPSFWTRLSSFLFLPVFNFMLLLFPYKLSYDWSMESIPRIQKWSDPRNFIAASFYFILMRRVIVSLSTLLHNSTFSNTSSDNRLENSRNMKHSPIRKSFCSVCSYSSIQAHHRKCSNNNSILCAPIIDELTCNGNWSQNMSTTCNSASNYSSGYRNSFNLFNSHPSHSKFHSRGTNAGTHLKFNGTHNKWSNNNAYSSTCKSRPSSTPSSSRSSSADLSPKSNSLSSASLLLQLAFLVWPFLPASNLFFYVGFVVAERVLYMPSVGFCLLVGHGFLRLCDHAERSVYGPRMKQFLVLGVVSSLVLLSLRTVIRNEDWHNEEKLYRAGIEINPPKSWGNLGNVLSSQGRITEAEVAYRQALSFRSNMADVHYNLGLLLEGQGRFDEALTSYRSAIHFRPRLASSYLSLGQVLTRLGRTAEAMSTYQRCFQLSDDGIKDLRAHIEAKVSALLRFGNLLVEEDDDARSAIKIYREAVNLMPPTYSQAQSVYNAMGEALYRTGEASEAEEWFKEALKKKPDHIPAHLTYGKMLARNKTRLLEAESWFRRAKKIAPADSSVYHHYGQFLSIESRHDEAAEAYVTAAELAPNDYDIIVGAANALRQIGDNIKAEIYYRKAVAIKPEEARAHMNLGAILHVNGKYGEAEERYLMALRLKPSDDVTLLNLKKLRQLQSRRQSHLSKSSCPGKQPSVSPPSAKVTNSGIAKSTTEEKTY